MPKTHTKSSDKSCGREDDCKMSCHRAVKVDVDHHPRVHCKERDQTKANFDVALDIKTRPRCKVVPLYCEKKGACGERRVFRVKVDVDAECRAKIINKTECKPVVFDLWVDNETKQRCEEV